MRLSNPRQILGLGVALLLLAGCRHAMGPEPMETTTVEGLLHLGKWPIGRGWVQVLPVDGTMGRLRSARLSPDGSFRLDKAPVGRVVFGFAGPLPSLTGDPSVDGFLRRAHGSFLVKKSIAKGSGPIDVDLEPIRQMYAQGRNPES